MFKKLSFTALALASALAVFSPAALAQSRDDHRFRHEYRERRELRAHERWEHRGAYYHGYYDRFGYWHPYR